VWLDKVKEQYGDRMQVAYRYFSLEQINEEAGEGVNVFEEPDGYSSRGLLAFKASVASRKQGEDAFHRFHRALLARRHEEGRRPPLDQAMIDDVARSVGLDVERLQRDMQDADILQPVARDHAEVVERYGAFGCPTIVFDQQHAAYLKMRPAPPEGEEVAVFEDFRRLVAGRTYIAEVKRPVPGRRG
jgi:predicted DsbA family dithiol-disulfide isomerase